MDLLINVFEFQPFFSYPAKAAASQAHGSKGSISAAIVADDDSLKPSLLENNSKFEPCRTAGAKRAARANS